MVQSERRERGEALRALYLMPSARQDTAFVTAMLCFTSFTSSLCASVLM